MLTTRDLPVIRSFGKEHPAGVGMWAARHGYMSIIDEVAPYMVAVPLARVLEGIPYHLIVPWVSYTSLSQMYLN